MKLIDIFKTASNNIWQSKLRTFLTVIAIFIGAFTLTLTSGVGAGISQYIDAQVNSIGAKNVMFVMANQTSTASTSGSDTPQVYDPNKTTSFGVAGGRGEGQTMVVLTPSDLTKIKAISGILDVTPLQSVTPSYITVSNQAKYQISITHYIDGTNIAMDTGEMPNNSSKQLQLDLPYNYTSVLGFSSYQAALGKTVLFGITNVLGQTSEVSAVVVGVTQKNIINSGGAQINTTLFDKLFALQSVGSPANSLNKYPTAIIHFDSSYTNAQITQLKSRLSSEGYTGNTIADEIGIIKQIINGIVIVFDIFAIITLLAASFGVINTLLMSVQERTKEIGLMKAMGMGKGRIFLLFSSEALLLGFWGSFLGVLLAMGVGQIANSIASKGFLKDFEGLHLLAFPIRSVGLIIIGIMAVAFLAGTLPARRAAGLDPIEALRYE
jgi:putative ABC transport system permease protein